MINDDSLHVIELAIATTEQEISTLDACGQDVASHQEIVSALEADVAALRSNTAGLDVKVRGSRFTATNSALVLAQSDLKSAQDALSEQKTKTVAIGKGAARMLFDARDGLQSQRQANVAGWLSAQFDWAAIPVVSPSDLAAVHQTVVAIKELSVTNLLYELQHDEDTCVQALRHLGGYWAELRPLVEVEPGLSLNIAAVKVPPVARPKPAGVGNQLGTLAQPVAV